MDRYLAELKYSELPIQSLGYFDAAYTGLIQILPADEWLALDSVD